ncbi:transporter substrate-binding domain-containing protein [Pseudomonas chlororaphis subsp. aurantiaca]|uniref:histidine kinase n=2 Tax=Pseudomonas chlororaphis TaxID=587753 RepID=A0AAJ0ZK36_9PSED|nr:transporter substrate-binding domain-containing protein [Pseudomonas chlororaphis subsp. aurantiaca]
MLWCVVRQLANLLITICLLLSGASSFTSAAPQQENTLPLKLVDRSVLDESAIKLQGKDWQWLRNKRVLTLGVSSPDFAPIEIISGHAYYEGVTADVLGVVGQLLNVDIRIVQFPDRSAALNALETGRVDIVGSANSYELASNRVQLSKSYIDDGAVLYVRKSEGRSITPELDGMRVALAEDYLPLQQLHALFPRADFVPFKSRELALAAVAFGNVDMYLGDAVSSNYLVNLNYFNYVRLHASLDVPTTGFAFAVRVDDRCLLPVLNSALEVVGRHYLSDILKRWSGGGASIITSKVDLSMVEQRWIERHPVVRFVVPSDMAPLSYFDAVGRFSGISADILKEISQRTGLVFEAVRADYGDDYLSLIARGKADLTLLSPAYLVHEDQLGFTRPVVFSTFAIVTRNEDHQPGSLSELKGKRIALPLGHPLREVLQPVSDYELVDAGTLLEAMDRVVNGQADATVTFLPVAQHYTMTQHDSRLKISNIIEYERPSLAFAMRKGDTELAAILNKAFLQIPPDVIDIFQNRWRPKVDVSRVSWLDYRGLIYKVGGAVFVFVLLSFAWNYHIRSLYKRRQAAELALSEQLNFMSSLIDGIPHPIYVRDRQGRMIACNVSFLEVLQTSRAAVIGHTTLDGSTLERCEALRFHDDYMSAMEAGEPLITDRVLRLPDRTLSIYHWVTPYHGPEGETKGVICGWIDISERRQLVEDLRAALTVADQSNRAKTTFLATMSHEIRTPMSAVIGMLELVMKHADQGRFDRAAVEVAYDSARGLLELIGDILDVVRIESGHISLSLKRTNLRELVESVARVFDGLARQKALTLSLNIDANVNCEVLADPMRFKQVLSNLVGNAIKFTDTGEVKVTIDGKRVGGDRVQVQLAVEDTGIGISAEGLAKLFQPFVQADHGHTSRGGTGLGLAISKMLCELMGGQLSVHSVVGKGTCVTLDMLFSVLPEAPRIVQVQEEKGKVCPTFNILVVDDQQANRILLIQQLVYFDQVVTGAENGEEGMRCWETGNFDLIITDCNMPVLNGYEMTRRIRELEQQSGRASCTIIGYTANAQPEEKAKCLQAGMDDCIFKPVSLTALSTLLISLSEITLGAASTGPKEQSACEEESAIEAILHVLTGGDKSMVQVLVEEAYSSYTRDLAELKRELHHFTPDSMSHLVHRIKGAALILDAQGIITACDRVEQACIEMPTDQAAILDQARMVEQELEKLIGLVQSIRLTEDAEHG